MNRLRVLAAVTVLICNFAMGADWRPVFPEEMKRATPKVDPAADAEAIFWDVKIEDSAQGGDLLLTMNHYVRIKIFTELGRENYSTVELPQIGKRRVLDVAGRTIKADGSVIELKKDAIFDRELVKTKGFKARGKSFTLPNVAVGDLIEYRYREARDGEIASHMRLHFQREIPVWEVTYRLKPLNIPWLPFAMRSMAFQCNHPPFKRDPDGFFSTSMLNMPAFLEEADMPPEDQLRAWMLIYYEKDEKITPEKYWKETGKSDFNTYKPLLKVDDLVRRTATEVISGQGKAEDKLAALDRFCRTKIRNLSSSAFRMTAEERKAVKENRSPGDTLKQKAGTGTDVNLLFAALAAAAGFDARMARLGDRGDTFFRKDVPSTYFLRNFSVAVKAGEQWTFFDPSTPYLERGMLRWQEEGGIALISDPKDGFFAETQFTPPARSVRKRVGKFQLLEDGTLEGTVEYSYTGHAGVTQRNRYDDMTPAQREEDWKESLQGRLSTAEMSGFEINDTGDPDQPYVVKHKVSVPGYATRTGRRMLLQPAFFQKNVRARYTAAQRKWDLYFSFGWSEDDEVTIDLPEGWVLDKPAAPGGSKLGEVGNYAPELRLTGDGKKLVYNRRFDWGRDNKLILPARAYPMVKQIFDSVQEQDGHTMVLKAAGDAQ